MLRSWISDTGDTESVCVEHLEMQSCWHCIPPSSGSLTSSFTPSFIFLLYCTLYQLLAISIYIWCSLFALERNPSPNPILPSYLLLTSLSPNFLKELFYTMSSFPIHTPTFSAIWILSLTSKETALKRLTNSFEPYCFQVQRKFLLLFLFFTEVVDFVDRNLILPFLSFYVTNSTAFPLTLLDNLPSLTFGLILSHALNIWRFDHCLLFKYYSLWSLTTHLLFSFRS